MIEMCLKTNTILLQCNFYQFQYLMTTCLSTVEISQNFDVSLLPKEHHQGFWTFLQVNDANACKNRYYSITIHFLSVSVFHNNMSMYGENNQKFWRFALTKRTSSEMLKIFTSKWYKCV